MLKIKSTFPIGAALALSLLIVISYADASNSNAYSHSVQSLNCSSYIFCTYTNGGWGSHGTSVPGKLRDMYFSSVFPNGLVVGSYYTLKLSTAKDVENFLPCSGTPSALTTNLVNPTSYLNTFAGQVVAANLNIQFNNAGLLGNQSQPHLEDMTLANGSAVGMTVKQVIDMANLALGGDSTPLSISTLNSVLNSINLGFDNCKPNNGFFTCPPPDCESNSAPAMNFLMQPNIRIDSATKINWSWQDSDSGPNDSMVHLFYSTDEGETWDIIDIVPADYGLSIPGFGEYVWNASELIKDPKPENVTILGIIYDGCDVGLGNIGNAASQAETHNPNDPYDVVYVSNIVPEFSTLGVIAILAVVTLVYSFKDRLFKQNNSVKIKKR